MAPPDEDSDGCLGLFLWKNEAERRLHKKTRVLIDPRFLYAADSDRADVDPMGLKRVEFEREM